MLGSYDGTPFFYGHQADHQKDYSSKTQSNLDEELIFTRPRAHGKIIATITRVDTG